METGSGISGLMNVIVSLMLGFLSVWAGIALARQISVPTAVVGSAFSRTVNWTPDSPRVKDSDGNLEQETVSLKADPNAERVSGPGTHD